MPNIDVKINGGEENRPNEGQEKQRHGEFGERKSTIDGGGVVSEAERLNIEKCVERFNELMERELKKSSRYNYERRFRNFANDINLERKNKKQLEKHGRRYILDYLRTKVPKRSRKGVRNALRVFWEEVFNLPWPLKKSDRRNEPKPRRRETPRDTTIKDWADVMKNERDPYLRLSWLLIAQHGWRPSHVSGIRWKHIRRNDKGEPESILMVPENEEFKTDQPIAAHLAPDVRTSIMDWEKEANRLGGEIEPESLVLPWRSRKKKHQIDWNRVYDGTQIWKNWEDLRRRYKLPKLSPNGCRHWVSTTCRIKELSKAATAYLQGHDSSGGSSMRDWYDNISAEVAIEEQAEIIPEGPLGKLNEPSVEIIEEVPRGGVELLREYMKGNIGSMELARKMEEIKQRLKTMDVYQT